MPVTDDTLGILKRQPNLNFLQGLQFRMVVRKLPSTTYFVQRANLAGMRLYGTPEQKTPLLNLPLPAVSLNYNDFIVTFRINADFSNYLELFTWLNGIGFPKNTLEYLDIRNEMHDLNSEFGGVLSDISLIILNNKSQPIINFIYRDAFIYSLSDIYLDTSTVDPNYLLCEATFKYMDIDIEQIENGTV